MHKKINEPTYLCNICGRVGGGTVRNDGWDGLWLDADTNICDVVVQIGTNTATPGDTVIGLMTSLLFSL